MRWFLIIVRFFFKVWTFEKWAFYMYLHDYYNSNTLINFPKFHNDNGSEDIR